MDDVVDVAVDFGYGNHYRFGCSVAGVGDVNKDGYDDVLVGVRSYDSHGAAFLYFGGENMDSSWDKALYGNDDKGTFGQTVSGTDLNKDGYSDLVIADIRYYSFGRHGDIKIFYGGETISNSPDVTISPWGGDDAGQTLSCSGDINNDGYNDIVLGDEYNNATYIYYGGATLDTDVDVTLYGEGEENYTGSSVASAGDVNGDGYDDVIVGAMGYNRNAGRAYIYFGGPGADNVADVIMEEGSKDNWFGGSVSSAGDVNNDGYDDVIVGKTSYGGKSYIYYGGANMDNTADVILSHTYSGGSFGCSVSSAGDVNNDGYSDVIIGDYRYSPTGRAFIYYGGSSMDNVVDVLLIGEEDGIEFGISVSAAGDLNNDGYADVIVGAQKHNSDTGSAYIYYGGSGMDDVADVKLIGEEVSNFFGVSVSGVGDVNRDGFDDLLVGARGYNSNIGRSYLYLGGTNMDNTYDIVMTGDTSSDYFGNKVAGLGDINKDGYNDVIIGTHYKSTRGASHIYYGGKNMNNVADIILRGQPEEGFGNSLSGIGDINNDGNNGVIVGAYKAPFNGKVYCYSYSSTPVIETNEVTNLAAYSVNANGFIIGIGDGNINAHGFCWNTSGEATITDNKVDLGLTNSAGKFTSNITYLLPNTKYYIRAFVTNDLETVYGEEVTFTTPKADQTITFNALGNASYGDANFELIATTSSNLPIAYSSSDHSVASISGNTVTIVGAGSATITASQEGNDTYYAATEVQQAITINKAVLIVSADDKSKTYGDANPAFTINYSGFVNSEDVSALTAEPTISSAADATTGAGSVAITLTGGEADNYSFNYVNGTLSINKAELKVTADNANINYGDDNPAFTFDYSGFVNGEEASVLDTEPVVSSIADATTNAGDLDIIVSGGVDDNYSFNYVNATLTIKKIELTATADDKIKTYGENNPELTISYSGFVNGEDASVLSPAPTANSSANATTSVGSSLITVSGGVATNYNFTYVNGTLEINKAELTVTSDDKSKTYGDVNPALTVSYSGFVNSENTSALSSVPTANSSADVTTGAGSSIITVSGGAADNYSFKHVDGTLSINKAELTITAVDKSKTYGEINPAFTLSYDGFLNGEDASALTEKPTLTSTATTTTGVGSYAITVSGGVAKNYNLSYVNGTLNINKATLTVTADDKSKIYSEANPDYTLRYAGFVNGEDATVLTSEPTLTSTATKTTGVGPTPITVSGGEADNYNLTYVNSTLDINRAELTVSTENKNKTYGEVNPDFTIHYTGFVNDEDETALTTQPTPSSIADETTGAGSAIITISGGVANNYSFNYVNGTLAISKALLTATADDKTKVYGDSNPVFTTSYTGFVNDEDASNLITVPTLTSTANETTGSGSAIITISSGESDNYSISYVNGILDINKAVLTVTANDKTKTYGEINPEFTLSYTGFVNGENASDLISEPTLTSTADVNTGAGSSAITISGGIADNYNFNLVNGTLTINKAELTVIADHKTKSYGDSNPVFTLSYTGFENGDKIIDLTAEPIASSSATATTGTGTAPILISGGVANNYSFNFVNGTLTINKAELIVIADDKTKKYGEANPMLTLSYTGFMNGEDATVLDTKPIASSIANTTSSIGEANIKITEGVDDNYNFNYVNGTLNINKAILTVSADDKTKTYGEANPDFTLSYTGFVNGDKVEDLTTEPNASSDVTTNAGSSIITVSGGIADNYNFNYVNGTLTINKAELIVTADDKSKSYGELNPEFTVSYNGFVNDEDASSLTDEPTLISLADITTTPGSATIEVSGANSDNYKFTYVDGSLTINQSELTVTADDKVKNYGEANPELTLSYSGFVNGENATVLTSQPTLTSNADAFTAYGSADILVSEGEAENYVFNYQNGTLLINKAILTVSADDKTKNYGEYNPEFTLNYSGFVNGENVTSLSTEPTGSCLANNTTEVSGVEIIVSGGIADNYDFNYVNGMLLINKAGLFVTADNKTKTYGQVNPEFRLNYSGFVNGEEESVLDTKPIGSSQAIAQTKIGDIEIIVSGGHDDNYNFNLTNGTLTIIKAELTVTADDKVKNYGEANPELTLSYSGFVNGEDEMILTSQPTITSTANATTNSGTNVITVGEGVADNYNFNYVNGTLSINKAELIVNADNQTREQGIVNPDLTFSISGFINGDDESDLVDLSIATCIADENSEAGDYDIIVSSGNDNNYAFIYNYGVLTVTYITGVPEFEVETLTVYPNPIGNWLVIKWGSESNSTAEVQIFSINGSLLKNINNYNSGSSIPVSDLKAGTYILKIKIDNNYQSRKVIKI